MIQTDPQKGHRMRIVRSFTLQSWKTPAKVLSGGEGESEQVGELMLSPVDP
jgi:hypothetical protein